MTIRTLPAWGVGLALALAAGSTAGAATPPPGLQPALERVVEDGAPGLVALVFRDGRELYRAKAGAFDPDRPIPIASASKWMTATLVLTLVDEGKLDLDEPIGRKLPELKGDVAKITLRQLLSFTSGQGSLAAMADLNQDVGISLETSALQIAARPLEDPPGAAFKYGSGAMQLAGLLAERVSGQSWAALFEARIAHPLGMAHTWWGNPLKPDAARASIRNPNLQAGVYTTADDYARFLHMLAAGGAYTGGRILSPEAFKAMETAQTLKIPRAFMPPGMAPTAHYAIGNWCESVGPDGQCVMASSPGAFGVYPWIDRASGLYGLFFLQYRLGPVADDIRKAREVILHAQP
ncbi:MAG: class A beta-lactamase-related serine hydrolase [Phenylobacterium sp.]|uniref:serine hydrolase domain-containing protein n=1 Tax=Phenylobacterium sp. TaxID=1871053 RepID=UPI001219AF27|nr:serine hydrolase domain-containing protein [Phenylobacterium sp.]TAJ69961.1 MAG: class A beta-lactamase-related serine hydrolase [Phenylobacterium sp.]